jgi:hypothetical protein
LSYYYSALTYWTPGWTYPRTRLREPYPRDHRRRTEAVGMASGIVPARPVKPTCIWREPATLLVWIEPLQAVVWIEGATSCTWTDPTQTTTWAEGASSLTWTDPPCCC